MHSENIELISDQLLTGASKLGVALSSNMSKSLLEYLHMLMRWGQTVNLTAKGSEQYTVAAHLLDSLAACKFLDGKKVLDVGSGAGLPGIPLSIALPDVRFHLLDSRLKRIVFLRQVKKNLLLQNVTLEHTRLEEYSPKLVFDTILSRAFAPLEVFAKMVEPLMGENTQLLAFVGKLDKKNLQLPSGWQLRDIIHLNIPGLVGERHLVKMTASSSLITKGGL
jgi:16S rRNA (guanine527-N7)-methyltransferase